VRASKQERRDAERKRRAHEAAQKSANKKQRKAERQAEAQRVNEQQRAAEQQALAERRARQGTARKRSKPEAEQPKATTSAIAKRVPKRVRREQAAPARPATDNRAPAVREAAAQKTPVTIEERGAKKLIVPFLIALLFAVTLGFALSRAQR
jgi:cell division protein FtsN